jgi:hypothetical protein
MKLLFLATALSSICAVSHAQWSFDTYNEYKCHGKPTTTSQSGDASVDCKSLDGKFESGTQTGGYELGCLVLLHKSAECSDVGCQALGTCCSSNNKSFQFKAYSVVCPSS